MSKLLNSKSNGLGLSISQKIAENMGGKILVESKQGQGAEFTLQFITE